jgi:hypothetical protein
MKCNPNIMKQQGLWRRRITSLINLYPDSEVEAEEYVRVGCGSQLLGKVSRCELHDAPIGARIRRIAGKAVPESLRREARQIVGFGRVTSFVSDAMKNYLQPAIICFLAWPLHAAEPADKAVLAYWPHWRGPLASGVAPHADPPLTWSETNNIRWKVKIPGVGTATPILWENKILW